MHACQAVVPHVRQHSTAHVCLLGDHALHDMPSAVLYGSIQQRCAAAFANGTSPVTYRVSNSAARYVIHIVLHTVSVTQRCAGYAYLKAPSNAALDA
jgi:hypothetical protein